MDNSFLIIVMNLRKAFRMALVQAVWSHKSSTTQKAIQMKNRKRSRVQKKCGKIFTKESAIKWLQLESDERDNQTRKNLRRSQPT